MTLRHGPVNGPMRPAPRDTVTTLTDLYAWRMANIKIDMGMALVAVIERAAEQINATADSASE